MTLVFEFLFSRRFMTFLIDNAPVSRGMDCQPVVWVWVSWHLRIAAVP